MSASVLARAYPDSGGLGSNPTTPRVATVVPQTPTLTVPPSSLKQGEKTRILGVPGGGLRISFASDTAFKERKVRSRFTSRSAAATTLNLRPVQGGDKPPKSRVRLPRATNSTRYTSVSHEEYMNPRKAVDIARSYGVPKYFLRGNTQILTDGRMRLFGDNVWKKERTSVDIERTTVDSSDVIHRLMDSVDKAIATSEKTPATNVTDEGGIKLEVISIKSGTDDRASLRGSIVSLPEVGNQNKPSADETKDGVETGDGPATELSLNIKDEDSGAVGASGKYLDAIRPHTVDTVPTVPIHLPRVSFRDPSVTKSHIPQGIPEDENLSGSIASQLSGMRLRQLASPFRGVSESFNAHNKINLFGEKYQNVLPRFYPAVSAYRNRQAEAERSAQHKRKSGQQRLVRFADTHTVRFSNETTHQEPIAGVVASRAPVQTVQRSLDSHSGLSQSEKLKTKLKEINDLARSRAANQASMGIPRREHATRKTPETKISVFEPKTAFDSE